MFGQNKMTNMNRFRSRAATASLFCLISLGQAYPFSVAWGMSRKSHACCCYTATPKPCGCDHSSLKKKKFSCHRQEEARGSGYSTAPCGTQTEAKSLNFRGENCLPRFASLIATTVEALGVADLSVRPLKSLAVPEPPPPRF